MKPPRVFISYSHDSPAHQGRVRQLADRLRSEGVDACIDQYVPNPREGWPMWMDLQIRSADFVLLVCTEIYLRRVERREEPGKGRGVLWEATSLYNAIYTDSGRCQRFIPVMFSDGDAAHIPLPLRGLTHYRLDVSHEYDDLYRVLTDQPLITKPDLGRIRPLPPITPKSYPASFIEQPRSVHEHAVRQGVRLQMIQRVRQYWIAGVLDKSLFQVARIETGLKESPEAVDRPLQMIIEPVDELPRALPPGLSIRDIFEEYGGTMLILGGPGSGKTTLLLELARDLLSAAERDEALPIPVVFNLSSWARRRRSITQWMTDELTARYFVPRRTSEAWVGGDAVLPLLDGLDEVAPEHREACVRALNEFRQAHGLLQIAVCSRTAEYLSVSTRLRLPTAITIQPLSKDQIARFLDAPGERLAGARAALERDPTLWELLDTPLMLTVFVLAYAHTPEGAPAVEGATNEQRHDQLFSRYVRAMVRRRTNKSFGEPKTLAWLGWLASVLRERGETVFYLENLQPDWLPRKLRGWRINVAMGLGVWLTLTGVPSVVFYLLPQSRAMLRHMGEQGPSVISDLVSNWLLYSVATYLFSALTYGGGAAMMYAFVKNKVRPVETLNFSWTNIRASMRAHQGTSRKVRRILAMIGAGSALLLATAVVLVMALGYIPGADNSTRPASPQVPVWAYVFVWVLIAIIGTAMYAGIGWISGWLIVAGFSAIVGLRGQIGRHVVPNEGTRRSMRMALVVYVLAVLLGSAGGALAEALLPQMYAPGFWVLQALGLGLFAGGIISLILGGLFAIQHLMLRLLLWRAGCIPYRLVEFLDDANSRLFLRKVGGGYIFVHRLLLEYLADRHGPGANNLLNGSAAGASPLRAGG